MRFSPEEVAAARATVAAHQPPTPQYAWPLLRERTGMTVWVKHENHTALGAFKMRGGLTYFADLVRQGTVRGIIAATRGNHGQSVGFAARLHGLPATIVVPHGNSAEKNAAMRALGVQLLEHGDDFQAAREHAMQLAEAQRLHMVPSFHRGLVKGVMTGWIEFFEHFERGQEPEVVFVPIGQGSGFCAAAAARAFTGARSRLVGVVSAHATTYLDSFRAGRVVAAPVTTQLADGLACRIATPRRWRWSGPKPTASSRSPTSRSPRPCASCSRPPTTSPKARAPRRWPPLCCSATGSRAAASAWPSRAATSTPACSRRC
jgi:threonine dehydratase